MGCWVNIVTIKRDNIDTVVKFIGNNLLLKAIVCDLMIKECGNLGVDYKV